MKFVEIDDFEIMRVGKTRNDLVITEDSIYNCYKNRGFVNRPIILNRNQEFKDYTNDEIVNKFTQDQCIGYITENVNYNPWTGILTARVGLLDKFAQRTHFDNWQIKYDKETGNFEYCACELFSEDEDDEVV